MANRYESLTNGFFSEMEEDINSIKEKKKKALIVSAAAAGAGALSLLISSVSKGTLSTVFLVILLAAAITAIVAFRKSKSYSALIDLHLITYQDKFCNDVYANIVGTELGGTAESKKTEHFEAYNRIREGAVLWSRDVTVKGNINGNAFTYNQSLDTVVVKVKTDLQTGAVKDFKTGELKSDIGLDFATRKIAPVNFSLTPMYKGEKFRKNDIKMDDSYFRFHVNCSDELAAYKYFTADVMEGIRIWNSSEDISGIVLEGSNGTVSYKPVREGYDVEYSPVFTKNMEKNRAEYSADKVFQDAMKSVYNIRTLMEDLPKCLV